MTRGTGGERRRIRWPGFMVVAAVAAAAPGGPAGALPSTKSHSDTVDDATVTLTIWDQMILGDARSWCSMRIQVSNSAVAFQSGDTVELWLYENDTVGDDLLWHHFFNVSATQVSVGVDAVFDCSSDFLNDVGSSSEIYADVTVSKSGCGTFCLNDTPSTADIIVAELTDDGNEEDDGLGAAKTLQPGRLPGRIAADADWLVIDAAAPFALDLSVLHRPEGGRLDLGLYDAGGVAAGIVATDAADRTRLQVANLAMGTWTLRVMPRVATDFNFYDLEATITPLVTTCTPGEQSAQGCGRCGTQTRVCNGAGEWDPFGACGAQGVCTPGETLSEACGKCGSKLSRCDDTCRWVRDPTCSDEGVCVPGTTEEQACPGGGLQVHTCEAACTWGAFGACSAPPLGAACTTDAECGDGLYCATESGLFPGGTCTQVGCSSDAECAPGLCVTAFGQAWCLATCPGGDGCRPGYLCVDTPSGKACQPPCRDDLDCWGTSATCGADGLCTGGGTGPGPTGDGGGIVTGQGGCGCRSAPDGAPTPLLPLTLAFLLVLLSTCSTRRSPRKKV